MGGSLSSPLGTRPHHHHHHNSHHHHVHAPHHVVQNGAHTVTHSTSVCNHLFSPPDGAALYMPSRQPHWPTWQQRKNVHPEDRRERVLKLDDQHSRAPFVSPPTRRDLPSYASLSLSVDSNSNYAGYSTANGTSVTHDTTNGTTVIPNPYSINKEDQDVSQKCASHRRHDFANNNFVSPPISGAATPLSPTHHPVTGRSAPTRILDVVEKEQASARAALITHDNDKASIHAPFEVRRRTIMHASTSDLLRGIGRFVVKKAKVDNIDVAHVVMWMRAVDRNLMLQGWQDVAFINPANLVFVFLLMRNVDDDDESLYTSEGVHQWVLTCLYVAYSYMGNEISYPLKPFLIQKDKTDFWSKTVSLSLDQSSDMLRLNSSSSFFTQVFADLKRYAAVDS